MERGGTTIVVSVIDDHHVSALGLLRLMTTHDGFQEGDVYESVVAFTVRLAAGDILPDVVLLDLELRDESDTTENVAALLDRDLGVVVYTNELRPAQLRGALVGGAHAVVSKNDTESMLVDAINAAHARNETFMSPLMSRIIHNSRHVVPELTPQQIRVLALHATGMDDRTIAKMLPCAITTVRSHLRGIKERYNAVGRDAGRRSELLANGLNDGYIPVDWHVR